MAEAVMTTLVGRIALWCRRRWVLPLVLIGLGAALQVPLVSRHSLWVDEVFSLAIATGHSLEHPASVAETRRGDYVELEEPAPASAFRRYLEHEPGRGGAADVIRAVYLSDVNPPLYYLLLYAWTSFAGTSDSALRLFSVTWALACLPLIVAVARRIGCAGTAWCAGVLFVFLPLSLYYSTEGRMYSLLWFCLLATALLSMSLYKSADSVRTQLLWVTASATGFLVHYFFVFPWLALVGFTLLKPGRDNRRLLFIRVLVVVVIILPWYLYLPGSLRHWRITQEWLNWMPIEFDRLAETRDMLFQFFSGNGRYLWPLHRKADTIVLIVLGAVAAYMIWQQRSRMFMGARLLIWLWFIGGWAGPLVFDLVRQTYTVAVPRYATGALPAAPLLVALALRSLRPPIRVAVVGLVIFGWSLSLRSIYRSESRSHLPLQQAAEEVSKQATAVDLILIQSIPSGLIGFSRYVTSPAPIASWVEQLNVRTVPESIRTTVQGRSRVFFVKLHLVGAPTPAEDWLRANGSVKQERRLGSLVYLEFDLHR